MLVCTVFGCRAGKQTASRHGSNEFVRELFFLEDYRRMSTGWQGSMPTGWQGNMLVIVVAFGAFMPAGWKRSMLVIAVAFGAFCMHGAKEACW